MKKKKHDPEGLYFGHSVLGVFWCVLIGLTEYLTFTLSWLLCFLFVFFLFAHTVSLIVTHDRIKQKREAEGTLAVRSRFRRIDNMCIRILLGLVAVFVMIIPEVTPFIRGVIYAVCYGGFCYLWCKTVIPTKERIKK